MTAPVPVLFVHAGLDWITGSERCLLDLVSLLDRRRFRPVVVCNTPSMAAAAGALGATVYHDARFGAARREFLPDPALVDEGRRIVREQNIRLIHANDLEPVKWLLPAARARRIPVVLHVHLQTTREERCYTWAHQVAHVVGVSRTALEGFVDDGLPPHRTSVIYNAVDPSRLAPGDVAAVRRELSIAADEMVLTAVGSLIPLKAFDVLLRAVAEARPALDGVRLRVLIVGDGHQREALEAQARALDVADVVQFLGRRQDVAALLSVTTIALSASRQEALPLNVLEAGFFGLPRIVSDIPPHREIVEDGRSGLIVPTDDAGAFARAIVELVGNSARRRLLGAAAHDDTHSKFLIDRYVREFSSLYEALLAQPPRRHGWLGAWTWPRAYGEWVRRAARRRVAMLFQRQPAPRYTI